MCRDQAASAKTYIYDGGAISEVVSEATEAGLQAGLASHGTMLAPPVAADSEAVTGVSLTARPTVSSSCVASPSCAEETAAVEGALLTSLPAEPSAEKAASESLACSVRIADSNSIPFVDGRPAHQYPLNTHTAQPPEGAAKQQTCAVPRAVAWEVPAGSPSLAASHALQSLHQTPGGRDGSVGVGRAPPSRVTAPQPAEEGVRVPPVQRDAATSPVRDVVLPYDIADR